MSLETETKAAINFQKTAKTCGTCKHCKEFECKHVDRMWYDKCTLNNLCSFRVEKSSTCDKHEAKKQ